MRRSPGIGMVAPRVSARTYRHKSIKTIVIGERSTGTGEVRVQRRIMLIALMPVTTRSIGLPHLDQGIRYGAAILVHHTTAHQDALSQRLTIMLPREIGIRRADSLMTKHWAGCFRQRLRQQHQGLAGRARDGRRVIGVEIV